MIESKSISLQTQMYPLIIGDSHACYAAESLGTLNGTWDDHVDKPLVISNSSCIRGEYLMLNSKYDFFKTLKGVDGQLVLNIDKHIADHMRTNQSNYKCVVLSLNGNIHNANFMIERALRFDFWDATYPTLMKNRQLVPRSSIFDFFTQRLRLTVARAQLLKKILPNTSFFVLPAPPPIPSAEHIYRHPEIFDFKVHKLQPAEFRLKIHAVFVEAQTQIASAVNGQMLRPPSRALDSQGFLAKEFWHGCTHANPAYYSRLFDEMGI